MSSSSSRYGRSRDRMAQTTQLAPRKTPFSFPDRLRSGDDADIDVAAPKAGRGQYLNQSFLSVIARTNNPAAPADHFPARAQEDSPYTHIGSPPSSARRKTASRPIHASTPDLNTHGNYGKRMPSLQTRATEPPLESVSEAMSSSQVLTPRQDLSQSVMLSPDTMSSHRHPAEPSGNLDGSSHDSDVIDSPMLESQQIARHEERAAANLPKKLAEVFAFDSEEQVESDFPCWLLQSVLLQGHLYVTTKHVCFYAYLPRNKGATSKSGYLTKRGYRNPTYRRYWFVLKGHALFYYQDASDLYFPRSTIDLRIALAAEVDASPKSNNGLGFFISTPSRVHRFKADSIVNAQEWVKQISQAIFRAKNDSDSVKVSLPIENMLDIDENPVLDFAETVKIRIIDNDETFAIDEYFFSFFGHGQDALEVLQEKVSHNTINRDAPKVRNKAEDMSYFSPEQAPTETSSGILSSPEHSLDISGLKIDASIAKPEEDAEASRSINSSVSASQILQRSDLFYQPSKRHQGRLQTPRRQESLPVSDPESAPENLADEDGASSADLQASTSSSRLQDLMRAGAAPLQKASGFAGMLRAQSKRVGSVVASESKVYYEKVTNMWAGRTMHFDDQDGTEGPKAEQDSGDEAPHGPRHTENFRSHFALTASESLRASYHGYLNRAVPVYGKIYVSDYHICFRNLLPGFQTKMILPLNDVETVDKEKGFRFGYSGLVIVVRGHEELFLEFAHPDARDDLCGVLLQSLTDFRSPDRTAALEREGQDAAARARAEFESLEQARNASPKDQDQVFQSVPIDDVPEQTPIIFDDMHASVIDFKPIKSKRFTCLTIGSRGDVQPYIALCRGLMEEGHQVKIATHAEFEPWIRSYGIDFVSVAGDPAEIMRLCVEHDMFTVSFFREATAKFRGWIDDLLASSWTACQDADILIESPSAMAGIHIAEALEIPYFRAFTMPWTRTRAYPHAFAVPSQKLGGNYNLLTYVMFDNVFWQATAGQINRWRTKTLSLAPTNLDRMKINSVPFLYNFSPSVVAPPLDFSPWIHTTGYWFLNEGEDYEPPEELAAFIAKARADRKKIVYVGFGSIVVDNPAALTKTVVDSVIKADVRCVLSKGWSDRLEKKMDTTPEVPLPPEIIQIKSAPHDWLFSMIDAAVHHGGAGTTGASLRAGIPTIVKPFFGDQFFFGSRIEDLGVGRCLMKINTSVFARALWEVTNSQRIILKAKSLGEQIRQESGVERAIQLIYRDLDYARSLIKSNKRMSSKPTLEDAVEAEAWTIVGDDSDFEDDSRPGSAKS